MQVWEEIYRELGKVSDSQLKNAILDKVVFKEVRNNDTVVLCAPDDLTAGWFSENFLEHAQSIAEELFGKKFKFQIDVSPTERSHNVVKEKSVKPAATGKTLMNLDPRFTFDNFIIGPSNDFAHAAALNIANNPGQTYNPLFIYGSVAVGKTHLLQAIAHKIVNEKPHLKVLYVTSENFTNEYINSVYRNPEPEKFRSKYRNLDVLLIDDIQFFQDKESTLGELFHTFNLLQQDRKQMVFACDRPPKSLAAIEDRLRTRFDSGLTVEIKVPKYETRKAILLEKAELVNVDIPESVIDYIAKNIDSDVRMLESSLTKITAYCSLKKKEISLDLAKEILRDRIKIDAPQNITITDIQKMVSKYFGISITDLKSSRRLESISYPRQIAMYLAKKYTSLSLTEIGNLFGGKAHTTVLRSSMKIGELMKSRKKVKREIEDIIASFYNTVGSNK